MFSFVDNYDQWEVVACRTHYDRAYICFGHPMMKPDDFGVTDTGFYTPFDGGFGSGSSDFVHVFLKSPDVSFANLTATIIVEGFAVHAVLDAFPVGTCGWPEISFERLYNAISAAYLACENPVPADHILGRRLLAYIHGVEKSYLERFGQGGRMPFLTVKGDGSTNLEEGVYVTD